MTSDVVYSGTQRKKVVMNCEDIECVLVRVVVVGGTGVGKSALCVRYLTKRYIGEYEKTSGIEDITFMHV